MSSGVDWRCRCAPSPSRQVRRHRSRRIRRCSELSSRTAAFTRAESSLRSFTVPSRDFCRSRASLAGSTTAAAVTSLACTRDSFPARNAVSVAGNSERRAAVSTVLIASPRLMPASRANQCAIDRSPCWFHTRVSATRCNATVLTAEHSFSMWIACCTSRLASQPSSTPASRLAANSARPSCHEATCSNMCRA